MPYGIIIMNLTFFISMGRIKQTHFLLTTSHRRIVRISTSELTGGRVDFQVVVGKTRVINRGKINGVMP